MAKKNNELVLNILLAWSLQFGSFMRLRFWAGLYFLFLVKKLSVKTVVSIFASLWESKK